MESLVKRPPNSSGEKTRVRRDREAFAQPHDVAAGPCLRGITQKDA